MLNTTARVVVALEAIEDGDPGYAADVLLDLLDDLKPQRGKSACRFCGLTDWPGLTLRHELIVHPYEVIDLESEAT
jgi:hypothetical protein